MGDRLISQSRNKHPCWVTIETQLFKGYIEELIIQSFLYSGSLLSDQFYNKFQRCTHTWFSLGEFFCKMQKKTSLELWWLKGQTDLCQWCCLMAAHNPSVPPENTFKKASVSIHLICSLLGSTWKNLRWFHLFFLRLKVVWSLILEMIHNC